VYGTRFKDVIDWADKHEVEGRIAFGSLPKMYRNKDEDFSGEPYLVADPERRIQWRALLDSLGDKPKIGLSWQGGTVKTGRLRRSVSLESLSPVLRQEATFISLQYKNAAEEIEQMEEMYGIKVHHWPRAVEAKDYDETAALVAELDMVISVTTAVIHLAGGLGVPCTVLVPKHPMWRYGLTEETMPWYKSVKMIRQKKAADWLDPINEAAYQLRNFINERKDGNKQLHSIDGRSRRVA
jgi:ADP-heptose:LPS heptosyltransferase